MKIQDKGVLVTGASRGLGEALSHAFAREGARVAMVARGQEALEAAVARVRGEGGRAHAIVADVGDKGSAHRIVATAEAAVGPIEVLVHNASTLGRVPMPLLLDTECEELTSVLETNVVGPFRITKLVAGSMALRRSGLVVHLSSDAAVSAYANWGAYSVSKAALDHLGRVWAVELESSGVRFLDVDPGEMDTKMHADAIPDADRTQLASPGRVAAAIASMVRSIERIPTGARLEALKWTESAGGAS
jgi:NAD(P)-dependent dehydrogenase (short-subunit alcohol dehydrogenase family)